MLAANPDFEIRTGFAAELHRVFHKLSDAVLIEHGERDMGGKMKQFTTYLKHGVRKGSKLSTEIYRANEGPQILEKVDRFFSRELGPAMVG